MAEMTHCSNVPDVLVAAADTFKERRAVYNDTSVRIGSVMVELLRDTSPPKTAKEHEMRMFIMHVVGKLCRFVESGCTHVDSAHDMIVYSALMETLANDINETKEALGDLRRAIDEEAIDAGVLSQGDLRRTW